MTLKLDKGTRKTVNIYLNYRQRAVEALAKYEDKQQYPTTDKRACLNIMDMQIDELKYINSQWIQECNTARGKARALSTTQFYNDFIVPAEIHRKELSDQITNEMPEPGLWERIKEHFSNLFGYGKEEM